MFKLQQPSTAATLCALITIAVFGAIFVINGGAVFPTDDAFINLHNAQVLRLGRDDSYQGVPALVGATSGLHLALLFALEHVFYSDAVALFVLGALAGLAYVLGIFYASVNVGCSRTDSAFIALSGLMLAGALFQLVNGMDTGLAMAAVAWNIKLLTDKPRTIWLSLLCGMMPFVRPELSFLSAGSMLILLSSKDTSPRFKLLSAATAVAITTPFLLWYWIDTGSVVPSTVGAKMYFFAERYDNWAKKLQLGLTAISYAAVASFPLFLCVRYIRPRPIGVLLAAFALVFLGSYFWSFPGGLLQNEGRYLYIFSPIVLFGVACSLSSPSRRQGLRLAAVSVLFFPIAFTVQYLDYRARITGDRESLADLTKWIESNFPERPTIMIHDAGYIAYRGHMPLVDLVGLKTPSAIEFHKRLTYQSAGELRPIAVAKIAEKFAPKYLVVLQDWDDKFAIVNGLLANGFSLREVYVGRASPGTPETNLYHLYELKMPEGHVPTAAARGRAENTEEVRSLLRFDPT